MSITKFASMCMGHPKLQTLCEIDDLIDCPACKLEAAEAAIKRVRHVLKTKSFDAEYMLTDMAVLVSDIEKALNAPPQP